MRYTHKVLCRLLRYCIEHNMHNHMTICYIKKINKFKTYKATVMLFYKSDGKFSHKIVIPEFMGREEVIEISVNWEGFVKFTYRSVRRNFGVK